MFSLFLGKISGVLSLALQGISETVGLIVEKVADLVDSAVETVASLTSPITDTLSSLPLIGDTVEFVLDLHNNLVGNLSSVLHAVAADLSAGDLLGGVDTALNGVTATLGQSIGDSADVLSEVVNLTIPVTGLLGSVLADVPVASDLLDVVGETTTNLIGFIGETGDYVAGISPVDLVTDLLADPTGAVGGVIQDASLTIENLLNDLAPVTDLTSNLPVIGEAVSTAGQLTGELNTGLYDIGSFISQIDLLEPLQAQGTLG